MLPRNDPNYKVSNGVTDPFSSNAILDVGRIVMINSTAGVTPWGGWITRIEENKAALTITCKEMAYIFSRRRLGKSEFFPYKTANQLAGQLTALTSPFVINSSDNADTNLPFSKEFHFTGGMAALRRLPYDTGVDWWVEMMPNGQGVLHTGNRGIDKTETALFSEGLNILDDATYTRDGEELINDTVFIGRGDGAWEVTPHQEKADHLSITQWGLYQATNVRYDVVHASALSEIAKRQLSRKSRPRELLDFYVQNSAGIWGLAGEGDTITVQMPSFGPSGLNVPARIVGREVDEYALKPMRYLVEIL